MSNWLKRHKLVSIFFAGLLLAMPSAIVNHDLLISVVLAAEKKVSELTALTGANTALDDEFLIVDTDATESKRITRAELANSLGIVLESIPGTACTATGTDAVCIGDTAVAGDATADLGAIAIGPRSTATGNTAIAIGENADATGSNSIAIGGETTDSSSADASGGQAIAIGFNSLADSNTAIAIGASADSGGGSSIAIGENSSAASGGSISIGTLSRGSGSQAVAIGQNADATASNCVAIGGNGTDANSADCSGNQSVALGNATLADSTGSVAIGDAAEAITGAAAIAIGQNADASGANCIAIGGNATDTDSADCSAADSIALGQHILADDIGEFAFASGEFAAQSDAHISWYVLRNQTTDDTQTELFSDASAGDISVPSDCTTIARIDIVARQANEDGTSAMYLIQVGLDNNAGTTAVLQAATVTTIFEDSNASAWDVTATADDTNDGINVLVTGAASDNINWVARAEIVESCG